MTAKGLLPIRPITLTHTLSLVRANEYWPNINMIKLVVHQNLKTGANCCLSSGNASCSRASRRVLKLDMLAITQTSFSGHHE